MPLPALSPTEISQRSLKLFNPNFKSPRSSKSVKEPKPTSLSWSKLPPPAAEIDERPSYRIRRFRLWKDVTPELRKVVLDPKKRAHLRRYQSYAIPATPSYSKRISLPAALPRPTQEGLPTLIPNEDEWTWTTPLRPRTRSRSRSEVSVSVVEVDLEEEEIVGEKDLRTQLAKLDVRDALVGKGGLLTPPLTAINTPSQPSFDAGVNGCEGFSKLKPVDEVSLSKLLALRSGDSSSENMQESGKGLDIINGTGGGSLNDYTNSASHTADPLLDQVSNPNSLAQDTTSSSSSNIPETSSTPKPPSKLPSPSSQFQQTYWLPPLPESKHLPWLNKSIHKKTRKINYQKLLENKWILDQEHERRFRIGMGMLMKDVMVWQGDNTIPYDQWKEGVCKWKDKVDLQDIQDTTELFKQIRKKSTNIYQYLNPDQITQVPFRDRVHELVKNQDARNKRKRERKEAKKRAAELEQQEKEKEKLRVENTDLGQGQVEVIPLPETSSTGMGVRAKAVQANDEIQISRSSLTRETSGNSRGTNTSHLNPRRHTEPNLSHSSEQTGQSQVQRGMITIPINDLEVNLQSGSNFNFLRGGRVFSSDNPHIARLLSDLQTIREQREKLERLIAENAKEIERRKNEKRLIENKIKGVEIQRKGKGDSDTNEKGNQEDEEEERYLNNPIDSQGNIIPYTSSEEVKANLHPRREETDLGNSNYQSYSGKGDENLNLQFPNDAVDKDTHEDTETETNLTLTSTDQYFPGHEPPSETDTQSTGNLDPDAIRFGSLNLDDDTAIPIPSPSPLSLPSNPGSNLNSPRYWKDQSDARIPSSAFSNNELSSTDNSDQSTFISVGGTTVRADDDQDQDQDTLVLMNEEQGDTKYGYSTLEGNSFDKFTLTGLDSSSS